MKIGKRHHLKRSCIVVYVHIIVISLILFLFIPYHTGNAQGFPDAATRRMQIDDEINKTRRRFESEFYYSKKMHEEDRAGAEKLHNKIFGLANEIFPDASSVCSNDGDYNKEELTTFGAISAIEGRFNHEMQINRSSIYTIENEKLSASQDSIEYLQEWTFAYMRFSQAMLKQDLTIFLSRILSDATRAAFLSATDSCLIRKIAGTKKLNAQKGYFKDASSLFERRMREFSTETVKNMNDALEIIISM